MVANFTSRNEAIVIYAKGPLVEYKPFESAKHRWFAEDWDYFHGEIIISNKKS